MTLTELADLRSAYFTAIDDYQTALSGGDATDIANKLAACNTAGLAYAQGMGIARADNPSLTEEDLFSAPDRQTLMRRKTVRESQGILVNLFTSPAFARHHPDKGTVLSGPVAIDPVYDTPVSASLATATIGQDNEVRFQHNSTGSYGAAAFNGYVVSGLTGFSAATVTSGLITGSVVEFENDTLWINLQGRSVGVADMRIQLS